ncbi:MAG: hypothetical protein V3T23_07840 [Nitrososphaerales archaeon]
MRNKEEYCSEFELLGDDDAETRRVDALIAKSLEQCAVRIGKIAKRYPDVGIGDTATDEAIASRFYSELHYRT